MLVREQRWMLHCLSHFRSIMYNVWQTTTSGLLDPNQLEKAYSTISYSRQFTSPWWQHQFSSLDVTMDPLRAPRLIATLLSVKEQVLRGRAVCALATGAWPGTWPSWVSDRAALGLQHTDVWGHSSSSGSRKSRERDPSVKTKTSLAKGMLCFCVPPAKQRRTGGEGV